jgi:glycosyltransferase involved in cell wall biosynthesis
MSRTSNMPRTILVNQSYRMQRMTGQQRYAHEIASRLIDRPGYAEIAPTGFWAASALRVWAWLQLVLPLASRRGILLSMTSRAPLAHPRQVLVVHDLFVLTNPEWFSRKYVLSHAPILRAQLKRAIGVIAVSEPVAAEVAASYSGPIVVAPNAPSEAFLVKDAPKTDALSSRDLTPGSYFLAVGSIDPRKNLPKLAEAYGRLSAEIRETVPLVLVGGGNAIYKEQQITWPNGTVDAGFVSDDELRDLYADSRAVVFVSLAEGFGLPLVEAAAAGAPSLVISDIPVFRWICGDGATYVDPTSVESIAEGLGAAIEAPVAVGLDLSRFQWGASADTVAELVERARDRA